MADLMTRLGDLELRNPLVLASGPLSHDGDALVRAHRAGAGAVVTKTISEDAARNPVPHIARLRHGLLNSEKWSDLPAHAWIERELPRAKDGGATVIASIGLDVRQANVLAVPLASAGADALEICSYDAAQVIPMVASAVRDVRIPVFAKVSANWPDVVAVAEACMRAGAAGITATDSVGPALRLDIERRTPLVGRFGWLSGGAIFPISLRVVAEVARATDAIVVGTGGVETADDCIEMMMAGASAVGLCSHPMIAGLESIGRLLESVSARLDELGYARIEQVVGAALPALARCETSPTAALASEEGSASAVFAWNEELCSQCELCVRVCPYRARSTPEREDRGRCRYCGLCSSSCPTGALTILRGKESE